MSNRKFPRILQSDSPMAFPRFSEIYLLVNGFLNHTSWGLCSRVADPWKCVEHDDTHGSGPGVCLTSEWNAGSSPGLTQIYGDQARKQDMSIKMTRIYKNANYL